MRYEVYCLFFDVNNPNGAMTLLYKGKVIVRDAGTRMYCAGGSRYFSTLNGACAAIDREGF